MAKVLKWVKDNVWTNKGLDSSFELVRKCILKMVLKKIFEN